MLWKCTEAVFLTHLRRTHIKRKVGACKDLVDEMQNTKWTSEDGSYVCSEKKIVVESEPAITTMVKCWPALFIEDQVFMEFSRIVGKNLKQEFYESIDRHSPRLELFRSKRGNTSEPTAIRTQMLRRLPIILGDNPTNFFKAGCESDDDDFLRDLDIEILLIQSEGAVLTSSQHLSPDLPKAMCILFGLTYALHLNYPKNMKLIFQFIQQAKRPTSGICSENL
ncbi:hypothetical protein DPEC_G00259410 [Dallia pectoralis]|uniref:Uncharacterized protein n=1 Tax=Dallia pectoralis TaxID=75939 RepID=A0ACC2FRA7_DALPE|nr:hypothetical protein DPEC_G00259410 [Dallia pectoralis]